MIKLTLEQAIQLYSKPELYETFKNNQIKSEKITFKGSKSGYIPLNDAMIDVNSCIRDLAIGKIVILQYHKPICPVSTDCKNRNKVYGCRHARVIGIYKY